MKKSLIVALAGAMLAGAVVAEAPFRWMRYGSMPCRNAKELAEAQAQIDRAAKAGLNGLVIYGVDDLWRREDYIKNNYRTLRDYARARGVRLVPNCWSVGYGTPNWIDPTLAETLPFKGMPFVAEETRIVSDKRASALDNGDLEKFDLARNTFPGWWSDHPGVQAFVDTNVVHGGRASVRFDPGPGKDKHGHARFSRHVKLLPGRRYRFSAWVRGVDVHDEYHPIRLAVIPDTSSEARAAPYGAGRPFVKGDGAWHQLKVEFPSGEATGANLYVGSWVLKHGHFWIDDLVLEEIGLTELSCRASAPRTLRAADTGRVYEEGRDWTLAPTRYGEEISFVRPKGSAIAPGTKLAFDGYMVARSGPKMQWSTCMSDPRLYDQLRLSAKGIEDVLAPGAWLLSVDEVRNGGTCELCAPRNTDMAHIFGPCITKMRDIIRATAPDAEIFAWSDMFDPWHNANNNNCGCRGTFAGSAELIPSDVGMMFWHGGTLDKAVPYFAKRGHAFIGSICCDGKRPVPELVAEWQQKLSAAPGLRGFMYTTWLGDYTKLPAFMEALK